MADNYKVFKAAHLHSKFWTHNSVMVPGVRVVLNEDFVGIEDILRVPQQIHHFRVWWIIKGVSAMVCIPGEWNYAYVDGKYFHLVKGESNGFVKGVEGEWFFYSLIYDDWQNEWLTNNIHVKGTIDLTGDKELAMRKINMIPPLIENVNRFTHLNGILEVKDDVKYETIFVLPPKELEVFWYPYYISSFEKIRINDFLRNWHSEINRGMRSAVPSLEKLEIPFLYKMDAPTNWKWKFISEIKKHHESGFHVYDVTVSGVKDDLAEILTKKMQSIFHTDQLFTIASKENRVYTYARAINPTKWISEIDLSTLTDITFIDRNTLEPFGVDTMAKWKEWTSEKIIDWVIERQQWSGDALKNQMREAFEEIAYPALAPLLESYDENEDGISDEKDVKYKLFFDVGIEKLGANIIDTGDVRGEIKNPEWKEWIDSRIVSAKEHRNFIWNNTTDLWILQGFKKGDPNSQTPDIREDINYDELTEEQKKEVKESILKSHNNKTNNKYFNYNHYSLNYDFNYLIYLYDEYRLSNRSLQNLLLDFSINDNWTANWFALIPDYHSMAFVPAFSFGEQLQTTQHHTHPRLILDYTKNNLHLNSVFCNKLIPRGRCALLPFELREVKREESHDVGLDWKRASADFYDVWYKMGMDENDERWKGAHVLSRGLAFMALNGFNYNDSFIHDLRTTFLVWSSVSGLSGSGGAYSNYTAHNNDYRYANVQPSKPCPKFRKADRSWRAFPIEFTFPIKVDNFDVVAKLKEFKDLPDSVLRWEVINTDKRKGAKPPINVRYLKEPKANADPEPTILTDQEQAQIPPNAMIRIYMIQDIHPNTIRKLYPNDYSEEDKEYDLREWNAYKTKTQRNLIDDLRKLHRWLCHYFFTEDWEHYVNNTGLPPGAIPNKIQVLSATQYPKNKDGQSQLALNYWKPYLGYWYMAWGAFYAPTPQDKIMWTDFETLNRKWNANKNDKDWLVTIIPNNYGYSGYFPQNIYQEKITEMTSNNMMAFMYNGLVPNGVVNVNKVPASFGGEGRPFNENEDEFYKLEWNNVRGEPGWSQAFIYNDEWVRYMKNKKTILLNDFIRYGQTWKSSKMLNPESLPYNMSYPTGEGTTKRINSSTLNHDIPIYLVPLLDPTNPECALHQWQLPTPNLTTDAQRLRLFKEKLQNMVRVLLLTLESWPMWFKLEGTDWYASVKLNRRANQMHWDYELFTSNPQLIKTKDKERWTFQNTFHGEDVDVLINSRYVLNIHGTQFNLKGRSFDKGEIIDVGLEIKAIEDERQSIAAQWYSVEMNWGDVDVIKTIIEAPKELTKYTGFNPYEREKLIRELGFKYDEYLYEKEMLDVQRDYFKFMNKYHTDINYLSWKYTVGRGGARIAGGIVGVAENALNTAAGITTGGVFQWPTGAVGQYVYDKQRDLSTGQQHPFEARYSRYGRIRHGLTPPYREYIDMYQGRGRPRKNRRYGYYEMGSPHYLKNWELAQNYMADFRSITGSLMTIAEGGMQIAQAYEQWGIESERLKAQYDNNERKLAAEGNFLNVQYEKNKENLLAQIYLQSTNTVRPAMNNNLIYKLYNKENKLKDVNMTVYYPGGKLAEFLKKFYTEFGYDVFERDVVCHGVDSFDRIIRYEFIYEINHSNETIKEMIRSRALMGVKVVEWIQ